ncbi:acrylyl-CoA reductase (NADPH) [Paracraurococcus ruber]|uniref:Oxidoreductase n=1 Tax=Paracraurococcus ruber TaxID=77675 RepID=A0ABS1CUZ0_9PROT|nr:MDR family oxidoreductase [Paracraurococcus ruber]MBK1658331.1 oxidoreductase [Paracraurococcus ruber]TDG29922.1 oxidoreductase [Paracraurococcus ruber]
MRALVVDKPEAGQTARAAFRDFAEAELPEGDVLLRVTHSTVNYKDGLAVTGRAPVVRRFPMVPGIDMVGVVEESAAPAVKPGDHVILNGWGVGETHCGAYAPRARVKADWLVPLPEGIAPAEAAAIGTAGYTAMLCVMALERHGITPDRGPVLVTGAAGGVGSVAIALLSRLGWYVAASTGRPEEQAYLESLGAKEVVPRDRYAGGPARPLGKEVWAAAVDTVGSKTLAGVLAEVRYGGAVAACGLAQGMDLPASVAPFILRGVALLGVDSVMAPRPLRLEAWSRLAKDLDRDALRAMTTTATLDQVPEIAGRILAGQVRGRVVVEIGA